MLGFFRFVLLCLCEISRWLSLFDLLIYFMVTFEELEQWCYFASTWGVTLDEIDAIELAVCKPNKDLTIREKYRVCIDWETFYLDACIFCTITVTKHLLMYEENDGCIWIYSWLSSRPSLPFSTHHFGIRWHLYNRDGFFLIFNTHLKA